MPGDLPCRDGDDMPDSTPPAIAKMANRCDEPVFGAASIAIDKMAATAAEARQTGVDAAAQTAFQQVLNRVLLSNEDQANFADGAFL